LLDSLLQEVLQIFKISNKAIVMNAEIHNI